MASASLGRMSVQSFRLEGILTGPSAPNPCSKQQETNPARPLCSCGQRHRWGTREEQGRMQETSAQEKSCSEHWQNKFPGREEAAKTQIVLPEHLSSNLSLQTQRALHKKQVLALKSHPKKHSGKDLSFICKNKCPQGFFFLYTLPPSSQTWWHCCAPHTAGLSQQGPTCSIYPK